MAHVTLRASRSLSGATRWEARFFSRLRARCFDRLAALRSPGWLAGLWALCTGFEVATRAELDEFREDLAAAHREAKRWQTVAARCEARIAELEAEVADSRLVATDLRARLVCLHGKLATTAATARYQSFTTALESRAEP